MLAFVQCAFRSAVLRRCADCNLARCALDSRDARLMRLVLFVEA